jgi:hypothetical protein
MAIDELDKEDSIPPTEAFPVPEDEPIEGPQQFEEPPQPTPGAPGPEASIERTELGYAPPVPSEAPGNIGAPAPLPGQTAATGAPTPVNTKPENAADLPMDIAKKEGEIDKKKAEIESKNADKAAELAQQKDEDDRLAYADYQERRKAASENLDDKISKFEAANVLTNPRDKVSVKSRLSVIFGGLGAALSAAGGGDPTNHALAQLEKKWDDETAFQKAKIGAAKDSVVMARTGLQDVDEARHEMVTQANAKHIATLNAAIAQGEAQLKGVGMSQADVDADSRIAKLKASRAALAIQAQKDADAHALSGARQAALMAKAARDQKKAKGGGGGGATGSLGEISQFIKDNPGDQPGAYKLAEKLGYRGAKGAAIVDKLQNDFKGGAGNGGVDPKLIVHDAEGNGIGTTSGARGVTAMQKDLRTIPRAIAQLKDLRENNGILTGPRDPRFHNAVLAVAATTSAGSTDANVAHEKGTLTNVLGLPNNDAIDRKIAELENLLESTKAQINPFPEGYVPPKRNPAPGQSAEKPAAAAAKPAPAPTPTVKFAAAKRILSGENKKANTAQKDAAAAYYKSVTGKDYVP